MRGCVRRCNRRKSYESAYDDGFAADRSLAELVSCYGNLALAPQSIPLRCKAFGAGQAMATIQGCDLRHVVFAQRQFARL